MSCIFGCKKACPPLHSPQNLKQRIEELEQENAKLKALVERLNESLALADRALAQ